MTRILIVTVAIIAAGPLSTRLLADDLDRAQPIRDQINHVIDVLAASSAAPSTACVSALDEMHTTDGQLKQLTDGDQGDGGGPSADRQNQQNEVGIARDVLATDLHDAISTCRPDAVRACATATTASQAKLCEILRHDIGGGQTK